MRDVPGLLHLFKVFTEQNIAAEERAFTLLGPVMNAQPSAAPAPSPGVDLMLSRIEAKLAQIQAGANPLQPGAPTAVSEEIRLSAAVIRFLDAEAERRKNRKSDAMSKPILDFLVDFLDDAMLSTITDDDLRRVDRALPDIPHLAGCTIAERKSLHARYLRAQANGWEGLRRNSVTTLELRYQRPLRLFFEWAIERRLYLGVPPAFSQTSDGAQLPLNSENSI